MILYPSTSKGSNSAYKLACAVAALQILPFLSAQTIDVPLKQQLQKYTTTVPADYALSFDITPLGTVGDWSSIIHYTGDNSNHGPKGRMPAVWFYPESTRLHFRVATTSNTNDGLDSVIALPLKAKTNVRIEAVGRNLAIFFNNTLHIAGIVTADRMSGNATVYVSDPWHPSASASLSNIKMTELKIVANVNGTLKKNSAFEVTVVPADYALSFDITPLGTVGDWSSIIHYTGDNSNHGPKGRMPAVWFYPESTRLHFRVATTSNTNDGLDSVIALPLKAKTNVRIEAVGRNLAIFFNDTLHFAGKVTADRISGNATVYVSDPWYPSASASLSNIKMTEIKNITASPVSEMNYAVTRTITETILTTNMHFATVYYDGDLQKFVSDAVDIEAASAAVLTTVFVPVVGSATTDSNIAATVVADDS